MMKKHYLLFIFLLISSWTAAQGLYDINQIPEIRIELSEEHWQNKLNAYKKQGFNKRIDATLTVNGVRYDSVGIRYKGNSSFFNTQKDGAIKLPFNIKINHHQKDQRLAGDFKRLKLSNVFRDPSYVREVLAYEIARDYMPASSANFAKLYINDEYIGLYNNTESVDELFLEKKYGESDGILIKCDPVWKATQKKGCPEAKKSNLDFLGIDTTCYQIAYELKSNYGWQKLMKLTQTLARTPDSIESVLNVNQTLWMLAYNNVLVNLDSYTGRLVHNYYLYQDQHGVFHPIIWDLNMAFGGFRFDGSNKALSNRELQTLSPLVHLKTKDPDHPLIIQLLKNDFYRKIYLAHIRTIVNDYFSNGKYLERAKTIRQQIRSEVLQEPHKLYDIERFDKNLETSTMAGTSKIIGLKELMEERTAYLMSHPLIDVPVPVIQDFSYQKKGEVTEITARVDFPNEVSAENQEVWLVWKNKENPVFTRLPMTILKQDTYVATIPDAEDTACYLIATTDLAATLSPAKAAYKLHEIR